MILRKNLRRLLSWDRLRFIFLSVPNVNYNFMPPHSITTCRIVHNKCEWLSKSYLFVIIFALLLFFRCCWLLFTRGMLIISCACKLSWNNWTNDKCAKQTLRSLRLIWCRKWRMRTLKQWQSEREREKATCEFLFVWTQKLLRFFVRNSLFVNFVSLNNGSRAHIGSQFISLSLTESKYSFCWNEKFQSWLNIRVHWE